MLGILAAINYLGVRHNKRWDLTAAKQFTLSDQTRKVLEGLQKPVPSRSSRSRTTSTGSAIGSTSIEDASKQVNVEYIDAEEPVAREPVSGAAARNRLRVRRPHRTGHVRRRAGAHQRTDQGHLGEAAQGLLRPGPRREDDRWVRPRELQRHLVVAGSENYTVDKLVLAQQKDVPADASVLVVAGPKTDFFAPEMDMLKRYLRRGGKVFS